MTVSVPTRRRWLLALWLACGPLALAATFYPVQSRLFHAVTLGGLAVLWLGSRFLLPRQPLWRGARFATFAVVLAVVLLPGRAAAPETLRADYIDALQQYEGVPYVWGGESNHGIDCSGLIRRGFIDTYLQQGLRTANPALLREYWLLWWHDCSAKALKSGFRGRTRVVTIAAGINQLDHSLLQPGDFAITSNGIHALAYLGKQTWIEADPGPADKVIKVTVPSQNVWFNTPVHIMRWIALDAPP